MARIIKHIVKDLEAQSIFYDRIMCFGCGFFFMFMIECKMLDVCLLCFCIRWSIEETIQHNNIQDVCPRHQREC